MFLDPILLAAWFVEIQKLLDFLSWHGSIRSLHLLLLILMSILVPDWDRAYVLAASQLPSRIWDPASLFFLPGGGDLGCRPTLCLTSVWYYLHRPPNYIATTKCLCFSDRFQGIGTSLMEDSVNFQC